MRIEEDIKLDYDDVLLRPKRSTLASRKEVDLSRRFTFKWSHKQWSGIPIVAANMDGVGTFSMLKSLAELGCMTALVKHYNIEELKTCYSKMSQHIENSWYSTGITDEDYKKLKEFLDPLSETKICIDVANGYSEAFVDFVKKIRHEFPNATIMAGNVVTREMTEQLILNGADVVKIGIGPGSVCTTRKITGVGFPQLSAVAECADAAHGLGGLVCADGGCKVPGDVAKAFCAGADFVMLGGMLAGHDEGEGEIVTRHYLSDEVNKSGDPIIDEKKFVKFYGMSSKEAQEKHHGGVKDYRASEGKCVYVPYKGPVKNTIKEILGGVRSAATYIGARRLKDMPKCATFVRVNRQLNNVFG